MQATTLRVLVQPLGEPRPPLQQRLVHQLDGPAVRDQQAPLDQRRDLLVLVGIELVARHAPARDCFTVAVGEPEQDPTRDLLLIVGERRERRLGVASDSRDAAGAFVGGEGE